MVGRARRPKRDSRYQVGAAVERLLKLEAVLDELGNGVDRALAQVCSLVNDPGGNALDASHGLAGWALLARPTRRFASGALSLGRGFPSPAPRRLARASGAAFGDALLCPSTLTTGGSGPRPLSPAL
jgi:hypothetical protein